MWQSIVDKWRWQPAAAAASFIRLSYILISYASIWHTHTHIWPAGKHMPRPIFLPITVATVALVLVAAAKTTNKRLSPPSAAAAAAASASAPVIISN